MRSNYKRLGNYIREVDIRNTDLSVNLLLGISIQKKFIPSIANTIGTDMTTYKIVKKNQFGYGTVTSRNGDKISIALLEDHDEAIVSQAYKVFEIIDEKELLPEYLMMWFRRPEFDRYARFKSHGSAREIFDWQEMCDVELPVPDIIKQQEIIDEYNIIKNRISLNNGLIGKLEETAQAVYREWFVDFEFPDENGNSYKSSGGEMEFCEELEKEVPKGWKYESLGEICLLKYGKNLPTEKLLSDGYYVFGGNGVIGKYNEYLYEESQIIIACRGAASGKINISYPKSFITNNSIIFELDKKQLFSYLKYFSFNFQFEDYVTGSAQPQITIENIKNILILIPNDLTLDSFNTKITYIDHSILLKNKENENLGKMKDLILSKMASEG